MNFLEKIAQKLKLNPDVIFYIFLALYLIVMLFLTYYRSMVKDEAIYYRETWLMAEVLKSGNWIGDYAVGLHGFLFKLPLAIYFLIFGASINAATIYTILIGLITGWIFFKLTKEIFKNGWYALLATIVMMTSFHFVLSMPTYLRDIPSLLIIVLFLYGLFKHWNKYLMSLIFVLLLDTKEYVFLIFAVFYVVYLFLTSNEKSFFKRIWNIFKECLIVFLPSLVWIILMFTTGIIPVNMFFASTVGLINGNLGYTLKHFSSEFVDTNLVDGGQSVTTIQVTSGTWIIEKLKEIYNTVIPYIGKMLYPRTFSFIAIPKIIIFPAVFTSFVVLKQYIKKNEEKIKIYAASALLIFIWLIFYILRASHGRYLLPILPFIALMLVYLLFFAEFTKKQKIALCIGTGIFVIAGFFFESSYVLPKILLEIGLLGIFTWIIFKPKKEILKGIYITLLSGACFGVALLFAYTQGQIYSYRTFGKNLEVENIASVMPKDEKYWINDFGDEDLIAVINNEQYSITESEWKLLDIIPKKSILKTLGEQHIYTFLIWKNANGTEYDYMTFKDKVYSNGIQKVVIVRSLKENNLFDEDFHYARFVGFDWLELEKEVQLDNKIVSIFDVKD